MTLSESLQTDVENMFAAGWDRLAIRYARLAADARDLETRLHQAELKLALLSEEG